MSDQKRKLSENSEEQENSDTDVEIKRPRVESSQFYQQLLQHLMTEKHMKDNGYPRPLPGRSGTATIVEQRPTASITTSSGLQQRVCSRCDKTYDVRPGGHYVTTESCIFHHGRIWRQFGSRRWTCCQRGETSRGCATCKLHVSRLYGDNLEGFVTTQEKSSPQQNVFSLDCEMCYTTMGMELIRVTVVDENLKTVYNKLVKPGNEMIDYNTRFSGITERDMSEIKTSLSDVHTELLELFSSDTILIGHSLEGDLLALKLFHSKCVDTSIVFPHSRGRPYKRALRNLVSDHLDRQIQQNAGGHDSTEDAIACMELMKRKVNNRIGYL